MNVFFSLHLSGPCCTAEKLQGRAGEVHQVILAQTDVFGEWSVLWQVPVETTAVQLVTDYFRRLADANLARDAALAFDSKWTPVKRLHAMRDSMPAAARSSKAWTLPDLREPAETQPEETQEDAAM